MNGPSLRKVLSTAFLTLLLCINIGYSLDSSREVEVNIRFHDRQVYYVGDPVVVEFQISNADVNPFLFIASYNEIFTFDFEISNYSNRKVEHSVAYTVERTKFEPILNDEIVLKPFEVYGARIDISKWFDLREPGEYVIRGYFYPRLVTDQDTKIASENSLYLRLNPSYTEAMKEKRRVDEIARLKTEDMPPYEVVKTLLDSLMNRDFEKYFIFINFEKFVMQFDNAKRRYMGARDADKPEVIEEFKAYLRGENKLEGIPYSETIPVDYTITKTIIDNVKRDAQVTVVETFRYVNLVERKQYTYYLHQYGGKWLLERYQVVNLGS